MAKILQELKDEGDRRYKKGQFKEALKVYRLVLEGVPLDFELRLRIADVLVHLKQSELSGAVYQSVVQHDIRAGNPLRAMVAVKKLQALGFESNHFVERIAARYASGAEALGRGLRAAPVNYNIEVRDDVQLDYTIDEQELVHGTAQRAAYLENIQNYPNVVPPVQLFSSLEREAFVRLLDGLSLQSFETGQVVVQQGSKGDSIYFLAQGNVSIYKTIEKEDGTTEDAKLARLGPGSLFGEMALVSDEPRGASVVCVGPVDLLVLSKIDIVGLAEQLPAVADVMRRFTQERMISNLLATNPLFQPFDDEAKQKLLSRFTGHDVAAGAVFLEEGTPGRGLYLLLRGAAEVIKWDEGSYVKLASLGPGSLVGEISLLHEEPISATVRTTAASTLLFLARELFKPLVDSIPNLLAHFARLAEQRLSDTEEKIARSRDEVMELSLDDVEVEVEDEEAEIEELNDDDVVFI